MSPYYEQIRLYGLELRKERMREVEQWRRSCALTHPTWLARHGRRLLCRGCDECFVRKVRHFLNHLSQRQYSIICGTRQMPQPS